MEKAMVKVLNEKQADKIAKHLLDRVGIGESLDWMIQNNYMPIGKITIVGVMTETGQAIYVRAQGAMLALADKESLNSAIKEAVTPHAKKLHELCKILIASDMFNRATDEELEEALKND